MEIKTDRALTESPGRWKPDRTQAVKWTTEGIGKGTSRVFYDVRHTLVATDMLVSDESTMCIVKQGGTAVSLSVLGRNIYFCQGLLFARHGRALMGESP